MKNAYSHLFPKEYERWHPWADRRFEAFNVRPASKKVITLAGGGGTGKSHDAAAYALLFWWANPSQRTVLVASTTIESLKKRIWSYISKLFIEGQNRGMPGRMNISPSPRIYYDRTDTKHGIWTIALKAGESERTLSDIIGIHPEEDLLVIVDEATDVTPGIIEAIPNWDSTNHDFQLIAIGNSNSRSDTHGLLSEPSASNGWDSLDPDVHQEWETKFGRCLFFDCYKSPAMLHPDNPKWSFLINKAKIDREKKRIGADHPSFWRFVRGFWPKDEGANTVLTKEIINKHKATTLTKWAAPPVKIASLDPAFSAGGDNCVLRIGQIGLSLEGREILDFMGESGVYEVPLSTKSPDPIIYQILNYCRSKLEQLGIPPEHFAVDISGMGVGIRDVFQREWSRNIHFIQSNGRVFDYEMEDGRSEADIYDRRVTQLWFAMQTFVLAGAIRGLDTRAVNEFCLRQWTFKGRKFYLEKKSEMKARLQIGDSSNSPDFADVCSMMLELARQLGFTENSAGLSGLNQGSPFPEDEGQLQDYLDQVLSSEAEKTERSWEFEFSGSLDGAFKDKG